MVAATTRAEGSYRRGGGGGRSQPKNKPLALKYIPQLRNQDIILP